ncbi:hypothetical protein IC762_17770 [Bradyrhizobium genosp. L]|uniref:hypothetical protein n=1 Tax=Bradyrhizobium genosp. L TaxID=83637 RepID=UPI0018A333FC|nr:hypothetical protein [Bradyrhizobium genosp. L]QPF81673.1 hypothetical protein IC762_17770 [Bradyrhizobium genosp. L]
MGNRGTLWDPQVGDRPFNIALTNNYSGTVNPGPTNDFSQGYRKGSEWINTTTGEMYKCVDDTTGAAVWALITGFSGNTLAAGLTSAPTAIVDTISNVTTADATHIAVILPTGVKGDQRLVNNSGGASAQTMSVYCQSGDTIDGGSAGGHVTLTVAHRAAWFYCVAPNTWISALVGAVST